MKIHRTLGPALIALSAAVLLSLPVTADAKRRRVETEDYCQYAAEFACGTALSLNGAVPGTYTTTILAHNPMGAPVGVRARVSLAFPVVVNSDWVGVVLDGMESRELSCEQLFDGTFTFPDGTPEADFYQGFVVIQSEESIDVADRATATGAASEVSVDVNAVPERCLERPIGPDEDHAVICHIPPGNPDNAQTLQVGVAAVPAHLGHGDHLGECNDD